MQPAKCDFCFVVRREREVRRSWKFIEGWVEEKHVTEVGDQSTASAGDALSGEVTSELSTRQEMKRKSRTEIDPQSRPRQGRRFRKRLEFHHQ